MTPPKRGRPIPAARPNRSVRPAYTGTSTGPSGGGCCPMVAAVRSVKRGQFRLARRYVAMSVRLIAARLA